MTDWIVMLNDRIIRQFSLGDGEKISIGRGKEADIVIDNTAISRKHISLESTAGIFLISDLGSTNGTYVNGRRIKTNEPVSESDSIQFGKFRLMPADAIDVDATIADSVSADMTSLEEETVFVTSTRAGGPPGGRSGSKSFTPRDMQIKLTLISGAASPREIGIAERNSVKVGKDPSCDMVITGFFVAKAQFYIFKRNSVYVLVPQKSWAGTYLNNQKVTDEITLHKGDIIQVRDTSLRFDS